MILPSATAHEQHQLFSALRKLHLSVLHSCVAALRMISISNITDCTARARYVIWSLKLHPSTMKRSQLNQLSAERQKNSQPWRRVTKIDAANVIMQGEKNKHLVGMFCSLMQGAGWVGWGCKLYFDEFINGETGTRAFVEWARRHQWAVRPEHSHVIRDKTVLQGYSQTQIQPEPLRALEAAAFSHCGICVRDCLRRAS